MAEKYFGTKYPLGKIITTTKSWGEKKNLIVEGVFEDLPNNSYFKFKALESLEGKEFEVGANDWAYPFFKSFFLLDHSSKAISVAEKMSSYVNEIEAFKAKDQHIQFH